MGESSTPRQRLHELWGEIKDLICAGDILEWEQETCMPASGVEGRGKVVATLAALHHRLMTAPELAEVVAACEAAAEPGSELEAEARLARREVDKATKVPEALARELAEVQTNALVAWQEARRRADFSHFEPLLGRLVMLRRRQAEALAGGASSENGGRDRLYNTLLDEHEPGATAAELEPLFESLKERLAPLVRGVVESGVTVDEGPVRGHFPPAAQEAFGRAMAESFGFDFSRGRLDLSAHPFCVGFNPGDVRITWRYDEEDLRPALFGILHETGHALYDQGLPRPWHRTPLGDAVSLGVHESQSRLWENLVGRSLAFWRWALPRLHQALPGTAGVTAEGLWRALHAVRPSLIRVEADEVTYNLHIAIRFEIERALFAGDLEVRDLPAAWDEAYERLLGVRAPSVADGVLQDVHWSMGAFGYFPTYTLGTLTASQLMAAARRALGDLDEDFAVGDFSRLLDWLRRNVHEQGSRFQAAELIEKATGRPLSSDDFLAYVTATTEEVYGFRL